MGKRIILVLLVLVTNLAINAQIRIRLYSDKYPTSTIFTVTSGSYILKSYNGAGEELGKGDYLVITLTNGRLGIKHGDSPAYLCDSLLLSEGAEGSLFSLRVNGQFPVKRDYSGVLECRPDMGTMVFINIVDIEEYIAGVVRAEGGLNRHPEYIKTQAIIARTYMYKYIDKHLLDGYNLCDGTHCQVFHGITGEKTIIGAVNATKGLIIVDTDSVPILAAFHSNCGGETAPSEDVWLTRLPYLKKVVDPHCTTSPNAEWQVTIPLLTWLDYLADKGYYGTDNNALNFAQNERVTDYKAGDFSFPLTRIRSDFGLRSTFFSVEIAGNDVIISGKGYGHGVGLCQEGAMAMANKGQTFEQIIKFYYSGVSIIGATQQ